MLRTLLLATAVFSVLGLWHGVDKAVGKRSKADGEIADAAFQCRNAIRPHVRGALGLGRSVVEREESGYVLRLTVYDSADDRPEEHKFTCRVVVTNGYMKVVSLTPGI